MFFGPIEGLAALIGLAATAFVVWGIVDAATRPDAAWTVAGQNKVLWIVLQAGGLFFFGLGLIFAIVYFAAIRPKVMAAQGSPPPPPL